MLLLRLLYLILFVSLPFSVNNLQLGFGVMLPTEPIELLICVVLMMQYKEVIAALKEVYKHPLFIFVALYIICSWFSCIFSDLPLVSVKYTIIETLHAMVFFMGVIVLYKHYPRIFLQCIAAYTVSFIILLGRGWWQHAQYNFAITYSIAAMRPFYNDHPLYGAVAALLIPMWAYIFFKRKELPTRLPVKSIAITVIVLLMTALFTSFSRAAWLSFLMAGLLTLPYYIYRKNILRANILFVGAGVVLMGVSFCIYGLVQKRELIKNTTIGNQVLSSFNWSYDVANLERLNRYKCALRMFKERPLTGFGNNCYKFQYHPYQKPAEMTRISLTEPLDNARIGTGGNSHSDYLAALTELGIFGFVFWMGILITSLVYCTRICKSNPGNSMVLFLFYGLLTFYLHVLVNNFIHEDKISSMVWMFWAVIISISSLVIKNSDSV